MGPAVILYATGTGTRRNLAAMRDHGFGLLLTPDRPEMRDGFDRYAIDNGAWGAHQRGERWMPQRWLALVRVHGHGADWCVLPDIVCGGSRSLALSCWWLPRVFSLSPRWLIAVQDGMEPETVSRLLGPRVGVFVGGSTEWKLSSMEAWGHVCRESGAWLHVGRVNSAKRIATCSLSGAHSCDGTSATRFAVTTPRLAAAAAQTSMVF